MYDVSLSSAERLVQRQQQILQLVPMSVLVHCTESFMMLAEHIWRRAAAGDTKTQSDAKY